MGISEAIARVRKGAKKAGLEGALASVGASLGAGLQSSAIPPRLRPAASRIASLLGAQAEQQRELPSLERAVDPHAAVAHGMGAHAAGDVCPFTGLRADGTVADTNVAGAADTTGPQVSVQELLADAEASEAPQQSAAALDSRVAASTQGAAEVVTEQPVVVESLSSAQPEPSPAPAVKAAPVERERVVNKPRSTPAPARSPEAAPRSKERAGAKRSETVNKAGAANLRAHAAPSEKEPAAEKGKEKLAGERPVAKTSARSANKPAAKQTNGRGNQKKK